MGFVVYFIIFLFTVFTIVNGGFFSKGDEESGAEDDDFEFESSTTQAKDCDGPLLYGVEWVLHNRQPDYGWGDDTHRAIVILELNDYGGKMNNQEINLMRHQLEIELTGTMLRHDGTIPSVTDLALYVQAILAIGRDPRDFHGLNLIKDLQKAVNTDNKPHPFPVLVLCSAGAMEDDYLHKLREHLHSIPTKTGQDKELAAIAFRAVACSMHGNDRGRWTNIVKEMDNAAHALAAFQKEDGSFGNLYTTALIFQALKVYGYESWNERDAMEFLDRSQKSLINNMLMNYYIETARHTEKGLFFSSSTEPLFDEDGFRTLDYLKAMEKKYFVHYTVKVGEDPQMYHTVAIKVPENVTFFDVMRLVAEDNPKFNFSYTLVQDGHHVKPIVFRICGIPNDAEYGLYWRLVHEKDIDHNRHKSKMVELVRSPVDLVPMSGTHYVHWYNDLFKELSGVISGSQYRSYTYI